MADPLATFSIVACDLDARQWGVAVESKFLAVGSIVPWAEAEVGAVATQAYANPQYGPRGLTLLRGGRSAEEAISELTAADEGRAHRQVGIVDALGRSATYTGSSCLEWAGGAGACYAAQGNILVSGATVDALAETFERTTGRPLAERLLQALAAGQEAGGDRRGQQSASLLVVEKNAGYGKLSDVAVDLRVDDHAKPIEELRRLYALHQSLFGQTPRAEWVTVNEELEAELKRRLARLGYEGELATALGRWAGNENLEERIEGAERVDPVVLEALRRRTG